MCRWKPILFLFRNFYSYSTETYSYSGGRNSYSGIGITFTGIEIDTPGIEIGTPISIPSVHKPIPAPAGFYSDSTNAYSWVCQ